MKISELEANKANLAENSKSLEYLIKSLNLENIANKISRENNNETAQQEANFTSKPINQGEVDKIHSDIRENLNQIYYINDPQEERDKHLNIGVSKRNSNINYTNQSDNFQMSRSENYYSDNFYKADDDIDISQNNN